MRAIGIDISKWQGAFDYQNNIDFIIQKVSEGTAYDDRYWDMLPDVQEVERRGAYHYFRTAVSPYEQANFFNAGQGGQGFKLLVMDWEGHNNVLDDAGMDAFWIFYQELKSLTTKPIWLYCTEYAFRDLLNHNPKWIEVPLMVARYPGGDVDPQTDDPLFLDIPDVTWIAWQWEGDGNGKGEEYGVSSEDVDMDVFDGTVEELDECLGTNDVGDITNPDPYDCDMLLGRIVELSTTIDNFINGYAEDYHGLNSDLSTLENDVGKLRLDAMAGIDGNQIQATANDADIDTLFETIENMAVIQRNNGNDIERFADYAGSLDSQVKTLGLGIAELSKRLETLQQGQLEIVEDVMAVEGEQNEFDKWIEAHEGLNNIFEGWADDKIHELDVAISNNIEKITELEKRLDDIVEIMEVQLSQEYLGITNRLDKLENKTIPECNHSHRKLFSWLFNK